MDITPNKRLSITYIHPKEAIIVDIKWVVVVGSYAAYSSNTYNDTRRG